MSDIDELLRLIGLAQFQLVQKDKAINELTERYNKLLETDKKLTEENIAMSNQLFQVTSKVNSFVGNE